VHERLGADQTDALVAAGVLVLHVPGQRVRVLELRVAHGAAQVVALLLRCGRRSCRVSVGLGHAGVDKLHVGAEAGPVLADRPTHHADRELPARPGLDVHPESTGARQDLTALGAHVTLPRRTTFARGRRGIPVGISSDRRRQQRGRGVSGPDAVRSDVSLDGRVHAVADRALRGWTQLTTPDTAILLPLLRRQPHGNSTHVPINSFVARFRHPSFHHLGIFRNFSAVCIQRIAIHRVTGDFRPRTAVITRSNWVVSPV